jgi:hypothetical protein
VRRMGADASSSDTVGCGHFMVIQIVACGCWAASVKTDVLHLPLRF